VAEEIVNMNKLGRVSGSLTTYIFTPRVISAEGVVKKIFKMFREYRFNQNNLKRGQTAILLQMCHTVRKFLGHAA